MRCCVGCKAFRHTRHVTRERCDSDPAPATTVLTQLLNRMCVAGGHRCVSRFSIVLFQWDDTRRLTDGDRYVALYQRSICPRCFVIALQQVPPSRTPGRLVLQAPGFGEDRAIGLRGTATGLWLLRALYVLTLVLRLLPLRREGVWHGARHIGTHLYLFMVHAAWGRLAIWPRLASL